MICRLCRLRALKSVIVLFLRASHFQDTNNLVSSRTSCQRENTKILVHCRQSSSEPADRKPFGRDGQSSAEFRVQSPRGEGSTAVRRRW